jgi:predicted transcriptional regulator
VNVKVQSFGELMAEMKTAARGQRKTGEVAKLRVESVEVLTRLLTPENRDLLRIIKDQHPQSIAALAKLSKRKEPNLLRSLNKLQAAGLLRLRQEGSRRVPEATVENKVLVEIDPYSMNDQVTFA